MRRLRHEQDLTQEELAARAELSMRYVARRAGQSRDYLRDRDVDSLDCATAWEVRGAGGEQVHCSRPSPSICGRYNCEELLPRGPVRGSGRGREDRLLLDLWHYRPSHPRRCPASTTSSRVARRKSYLRSCHSELRSHFCGKAVFLGNAGGKRRKAAGSAGTLQGFGRDRLLTCGLSAGLKVGSGKNPEAWSWAAVVD